MTIWPEAACAAIERALFVEVNGGELEHIATVYRPGGQALIILHALAKAGFDVRKLVHDDGYRECVGCGREWYEGNTVLVENHRSDCPVIVRCHGE